MPTGDPDYSLAELYKNQLGSTNQWQQYPQQCFVCGCFPCHCYKYPPVYIPQIVREVIMQDDKGSKAIKIVKKLMEKEVVKKDITVPQLIELLDSLIQEL